VLLAHHTIRAPFAGVIVSRNAQVGETISPLSAGGGFTRTGICTLVDMTSIAVEVDVGEALIGRVAAGRPVEIRLNSDPDRVYRGRVLQKIPSASRDRGTVRVRIAFDRVDDRVIPDLAAKVTFV
jgi:HlyD family secretion protein